MENLEFNELVISQDYLNIGSLKVNYVKFVGRFSNENAYKVSKKINVIFEDGIYNVIFDFLNLDYVNSVGVAMILTLIKTIDQNSGKAVIGGVSPSLEGIMKLIDLPKRIQVYNNLDEAKKFFN